MPKRVIDFDAMWGSDKLAACAEWAQAEYAWLYGLADASGCFELTNLRVIWGRVAAIRKNLSIERLEQILEEFQDQGLLFVWSHEGKRYGHWTGSDVPGRLPPPSWRMRLERFAPPVPKQQLAQYMSRFARGRAALSGAGHCQWTPTGQAQGTVQEAGRESEFADLPALQRAISGNPAGGVAAREARAAETAPAQRATQVAAAPNSSSENRGLKGGVEEAQAQDLELDWDWARERIEKGRKFGEAQDPRQGSAAGSGTPLPPPIQVISNSTPAPSASDSFRAAPEENPRAEVRATGGRQLARWPRTEKEMALERALRLGHGPVCGPGMVKPEALERDRQRQAAHAASRAP